MSNQRKHSYRAVVEVSPSTYARQLPLTSTIGLKARSFGDAIELARAVSALPVRCVYRQDRGAA